MKHELFIFIANWKLNVSYQQAQKFLTIQNNFIYKGNQLIICPTFPLLPILYQQLQQPLQIGAQNCSEFTHGSHTGEVDAQTLHHVGCTYCIIGHSERRTLFGETNKQISQKIRLLIKNAITPIICIGEQEECSVEQIQNYLEKQLNALQLNKYKQQAMIISYEPSWAIGSGKLPKITTIIALTNWLQKYCTEHQLSHTKIIYGGSVNENNIDQLKQIVSLNGVIIGTASADFQKLINIVSL
jgi:triosephosphate isomerase